jgi:tRNA (adenine57-N1/adenine58-N1)-methyltransferase
VDAQSKHYLIRLKPGSQFFFHQGVVQHDSILGNAEGCAADTSLGRTVWAYRPTLQDFLLEMPRTSAIIYPKDIAFLLFWADIFPGARVFEAGLGSGALAIALLRTVGPEGTLVTYETRQDMVDRGQANAHPVRGETPTWTIRVRDVFDGFVVGPFDRIVLDLPDPGRLASRAVDALCPGGILCSYVPNVTQAQASAEAYQAVRGFSKVETYETVFRPWEFRGPTARPVRSMISHTGFLTFARKGPPRRIDR